MEIASQKCENLDFSAICRTCLSNQRLNPIFENPLEYKGYSSALLIVAGIQVDPNDELPQKMCTECVNILNISLKFRKRCKDVETKLLKQLSKNIDGDIKSEDLDTKDTLVVKFYEEDVDVKEENCNYDDDKPLKWFIEIPPDIQGPKLVEKTLNIIDTPGDELTQSIETDNDNEEQAKYESEKAKRRIRKKEKKCRELLLPYREMEGGDDKIQRVACNVCDKNLSIRSIEAHMARLHPGADTRKVKCELCDRYMLADKMNRHVKMMHGVEGFGCAYCKTDFDSREGLMDHVVFCDSKNKKRKGGESSRKMAECEVCHKAMLRASLRTHRAVQHAGLGPVCEHCGIKFGSKFRMNEHYRAKHGYEKFKCSYCEFESASILSMRNHERQHRGEKPFVCEACGAKFHARYLLAQHRQSHRRERPDKCEFCPARFKTRNSLHAHRRARHGAGRGKPPTANSDARSSAGAGPTDVEEELARMEASAVNGAGPGTIGAGPTVVKAKPVGLVTEICEKPLGPRTEVGNTGLASFGAGLTRGVSVTSVSVCEGLRGVAVGASRVEAGPARGGPGLRRRPLSYARRREDVEPIVTAIIN